MTEEEKNTKNTEQPKAAPEHTPGDQGAQPPAPETNEEAPSTENEIKINDITEEPHNEKNNLDFKNIGYYIRKAKAGEIPEGVQAFLDNGGDKVLSEKGFVNKEIEKKVQATEEPSEVANELRSMRIENKKRDFDTFLSKNPNFDTETIRTAINKRISHDKFKNSSIDTMVVDALGLEQSNKLFNMDSKDVPGSKRSVGAGTTPSGEGVKQKTDFNGMSYDDKMKRAGELLGE